MTDLPAPLAPPDCDLRDFAFMPLDVRRLLTSETWLLGSAEEKVAAVALWCEAWHQVPASSLPDNEKMLAHLSQAGPRWKKVREHVMRSWVKCSDGRLYHPVVAEKALESWGKKEAQRERSRKANDARWGKKEEANAGGDAERRTDRRGVEGGHEASQDERRYPQGYDQGLLQGNPQAVPDVIPQASRKESRDDPKGQGQGHKEDNRAAQRSTTATPLDEVEEACFRAIGDPERTRVPSAPGLLNLAPILRFLDAGYPLDRIVGIIKAKSAKLPKSLGSWSYFASAIEEELGRPPPTAPKSNGHDAPDWDKREWFISRGNDPLIDWGDPWSWPEAERARPGFARLFRERAV